MAKLTHGTVREAIISGTDSARASAEKAECDAVIGFSERFATGL